MWPCLHELTPTEQQSMTAPQQTLTDEHFLQTLPLKEHGTRKETSLTTAHDTEDLQVVQTHEMFSQRTKNVGVMTSHFPHP